MTHDVVREITCQLRLVGERQLHHRAAGLVTFTMKQEWSSYGLRQEEVNGSDRLIYLTPLTSVACRAAHRELNMSPGPASVSLGFTLGSPRALRGEGDRDCVV